MPPTTTQISATLNTAKCINSTLNISTTKPRNARSIRLPTAPARISVRQVLPRGWRKKFFQIASASTTDMTAEIKVSSQVCSSNMEKAAPVFCT